MKRGVIGRQAFVITPSPMITKRYLPNIGIALMLPADSMEIVLVCQDLSQVAMFIRTLVEQTIRSSKLTAIGSKTRYRIDFYEGAVTGPKPPLGRRIREIQGKYKPEIYALYRSHTQSEAGKVGGEVKADKRSNILKSWRIKISIVAIFLLPLKYSSTWRLVGRYVIGALVYFEADSDGGSRRVPAAFCSRPDGFNWTCKLDGELITAWSGPPPPAFNQWFSASAASPSASLQQR